MLIAKVFLSGNSQAIQIPKEIETNLSELSILKVGDGYILFPKDDPWFLLSLGLGGASEDYMTERTQPETAEREEL